MSNVFRDQEKFMRACGQSVGEPNQSQYTLYKSLITEEFNELQDADNLVDELDALIDLLVVVVGALHSGGYDAEGAWKEVMRSNFDKIDKETGLVRKRDDGKILKPLHWQPPQLAEFVTKK
jgi:predicted HAD superfamily Cof-like phosphohydrolase